MQKYHENEMYKKKTIHFNIEKYKNDIHFANNIKMRNVITHLEVDKKRKEVDYVIEQFKQKISSGPEYVCAVCHRCCFKTQVKHCNKSKYLAKSTEVACVAEKCITLNYLHTCNKHCSQDCVYKNSPFESLWICHT